MGQAVRTLVEFPKPPESEPETDATSERGLPPVPDGDKKDEGQTQGDATQREKGGKEPSESELPPPPRSWFNTVVYGTPTLLLNPAKG